MTAKTTSQHEQFRSEVRRWFDANAPQKGSAADFSSIHIVSATQL